MNKYYFPIIGEYDPIENKFALAIISLKDMNINVCLKADRSETKTKTIYPDNIIIIPLKKNTTVRQIFDLDLDILNYHLHIDDNVLKINIRSSYDKHINVFNCDCQFVPECDTWSKVSTSYTNTNTNTDISFHIGDQIYMDLIFMDICNNIHKLKVKETDDIKNQILSIKPKLINRIEKLIVSEYIKAFNRKVNVLQGCFNIFLADDHEIADEEIRIKYGKIGEYVKLILRSKYKELQKALRLGNKSSVDLLTYGRTSFLLIDNIDALAYETYKENIESQIDLVINRNLNLQHLFILSPRILFNIDPSSFNKFFFNTQSSNADYTSIYDKLFSLKTASTTILCGDVHSQNISTIKRRNTSDLFPNQLNLPDIREKFSIKLMTVGAMNSVLNSQNNFSIKGKSSTNYEYIISEEYVGATYHSYIEIKDYKPKYIENYSFINNFFGAIVYIFKKLCHQYMLYEI
jgi:hypothetical protein